MSDDYVDYESGLLRSRHLWVLVLVATCVGLMLVVTSPGDVEIPVATATAPRTDAGKWSGADTREVTRDAGPMTYLRGQATPGRRYGSLGNFRHDLVQVFKEGSSSDLCFLETYGEKERFEAWSSQAREENRSITGTMVLEHRDDEQGIRSYRLVFDGITQGVLEFRYIDQRWRLTAIGRAKNVK